MSDKRGFAVVVKHGKIESFNGETARGVVVVGDDKHGFHSACYSSQPTRFPRSGEEVEVVFSSESDHVVRVRAA